MIGVIGLNHKTAPVHIRECLTFDEEEIELICTKYRESEPEGEITILSTCNRSEVYFSIPRPCETHDFDFIEGILKEAKERFKTDDALNNSLFVLRRFASISFVKDRVLVCH